MFRVLTILCLSIGNLFSQDNNVLFVTPQVPPKHGMIEHMTPPHWCLQPPDKEITVTQISTNGRDWTIYLGKNPIFVTNTFYLRTLHFCNTNPAIGDTNYTYMPLTRINYNNESVLSNLPKPPTNVTVIP